MRRQDNGIFPCEHIRKEVEWQAPQSGDHRCDRGALDAKRGKSEFAEDQNVVQNEVYADSGDAGEHGRNGLLRFSHGGGVGLGDRVREQSDEHDLQVFFSVREC